MTAYRGPERRVPVNNSVWRIIQQVGFPIVVALILLGLFAGQLQLPTRDTTGLADNLKQVATSLQQHDERTQTLVTLIETQTRLLRSICRHTAIGDPSRAECGDR